MLRASRTSVASAPPSEPPASDEAGGDGFSVSGAADGVPLEVRDVELEVQYLQGRNFHRGEDPALGKFHRFWPSLRQKLKSDFVQVQAC